MDEMFMVTNENVYKFYVMFLQFSIISLTKLMPTWNSNLMVCDVRIWPINE